MHLTVKLIRFIFIFIISIVIVLFLCFFVLGKPERLEDGVNYGFCLGGSKGCEVEGTLNGNCERPIIGYTSYVKCKDDYNKFGRK